MNLTVRNFPESCTEQQVRDFLKKELGHYASEVEVYEVGTPAVYAVVELDASVPYVGEVIARQVHALHMNGVALEASSSLFGDEPDKRQQQ
ncbi:RNA-binding protein [Paraburkholderia saeva]|uniref:RNA-binding protein n=1 Tax=Paraburkholderia saeva TaxID=2777537 RepID=A0A9N8S2H9_9BURK|nr:RNA-binding protein [Paraburkholderia saeva]CAG4916858.1 hypothetical protein R52603_04491 [Paraburkholderia saeva]CAG4923048.1 hypothetical protein R70241_05121 [Paraburkholderia saeva]CAG4927904.1 hypothetical protein LMG31841_05751 [Paraburkholderia saeva]